MWAWLQEQKRRRWDRADRQRRAQLERAAFADGRFVMYLAVSGRATPICFTPREAEAAMFFSSYLIPWMRGELRWLSHADWGGLPGELVATPRAPFLEVFRGYDVRQVTVLAPTPEYRARLDLVIAELVRAAKAKAEADRLAEKSAQYTTWVAAMRDAQRNPGEDRR